MNNISNISFTQNRELSWLRFNDRVLDEATDETVPLLQRLQFVSIFSSNLDEFFMIRVGSLFDLMNLKETAVDNKSGMTPREQLDAIYTAVKPLYRKFEAVFSDIEHQLRVHGIYQLSYKELEGTEKKYIKQYFEDSIAPILSPQIVDSHHPFPHLQNKTVHAGAILKHKSKELFAMIPVPSALPDVVYLPGNEVRYIKTSDIILEHMQDIFSGYEVAEKVLLCVTRNADINPGDEAYDVGIDFRNKMEKALKQRRRLAVVRLELSSAISDDFYAYLCEKLSITKKQIFVTKTPFKLDYVFGLEHRLTPVKQRALTYKPFEPQPTAQIHKNESILKQVLKKDVLLSYPFESMEPFLQMIKEAANDPSVISIKITIYRLASRTKLVEYLCAAAENGKDVTVLIELRARFDEQNNIDWSKRLEEAGCNIIYGFEDYKVHSKLCLIVRRDRNAIKYITQVGTGNYNEKTASMYTDVSLLTGNQEIGQDANEFFKNMAIGNLKGQYTHLLVAPYSLKSRIIQLIDEEIAKGNNGRITLKLNSVTDMDIMEKLKQASCAGVQIKMVVRGICCILPGIEGKTDNISITSIVGRYLEHSRIYCFGSGKDEKMYISSADFMTRNTERRVEVACPIYDENVREKLHSILEACEYDNLKSRILQNDGTYRKKDINNAPIDSQQLLMNQAEADASQISDTPSHAPFTTRISNFLKDLALKVG